MRTAALAVLAILLVQPLAPTAAAHHSQPAPTSVAEEITRHPGVTWRSVAYAPDGSHALLAGDYEGPDGNRSVLAEWRPGEALTWHINRSGGGFVDVAFDDDGDSLVVGIKNEVLLGEPGAYRNVWNESQFADSEANLTFYGLGAAFRPGHDNAVITGSSLLSLASNGSLEALHGGRNAFFRAIDWNPQAPYALVEAALQREGSTVLGTVWRTDGHSALAQEDNVAIYGRNAPGSALLNSISFAPNGSFALLSGRDGAGASVFTWASARPAQHDHPDREDPHDHRWRYQATSKAEGPITCTAWHPTGRYAITTGLTRDVLGIASTRSWQPLVHQGPDLYGCAMHPDGTHALAAGANGTLLRVPHEPGPVATVVHPQARTLVAPQADQTVLVDVIDRGEVGNVSVTAHVDGDGEPESAFRDGPWWRLDVNTSALADGRHTLHVTARSDAGTARVAHPFLVNNERFTPDTPTMRSPLGLEGRSSDSDGVFTLRWTSVDGPVVYQVRQERIDEGANASRVINAGDGLNLTTHVTQDGTYAYSVRAVNAYNQSAWSESLVVSVVLDSDGDGVPDRLDPEPRFPNDWGDPDGDGITTDVELQQCSDPHDPNSTPATDDDGDGIPNGRECLMGSDPLDPNDPEPQTDDNTTDGNDTAPPDDTDPIPSPSAALLAALLGGIACLVRRRA